MSPAEQAAAIARCDREIAEIEERAEGGTMPAWLVTLGVEDWEAEKRLLQKAGGSGEWETLP